MPAERRHIMFKPAEYAEAIREYRRRCGQALPAAALAGCHVSGEDRVGVELVLDVQGTEQRVTLKHDEVLAALVFYCLNNQLPIPQRTPKGLRRFADCIAITMEADIPMRYGLSAFGAAA